MSVRSFLVCVRYRERGAGPWPVALALVTNVPVVAVREVQARGITMEM